MRGFFRWAFGVSVLSAAFTAGCSGADSTGFFAPPEPGSGPGADPDGGSVRDNDGGKVKDGAREDVITPTSFACGMTDAGDEVTCTGKVCCANQNYDPLLGGSTTYACVSSAASCSATTEAIIRCHNGGECGGQYCCGDYDGVEYRSVACSPTCTRTFPDSGVHDHVRFCDPKNGSAECNPGEQCTPSTALPGYYRCA